MKILHVLRAPVGGLFRHVVDLAEGQIARGHEVGIVADSTPAGDLSEATLAALAPKLALGLTRIPIRRNPHVADIVAVWRVARRINITGAEIVHGHGAKGGALARLAPAESPIVRAYTPHGGSLHDDVGSRLHILMERALMPLGQLYLFESAYSRDAYRRKVGEPDALVSVVHNGVRPAELAPIALADGAADIVYLGELRHLKGVDVLIDAIVSMRRNGRAVTAKLVGDGPDRAAFQARIEQAAMTGQITLCGPLPTRQALALGRIVVLPSRAESLPYVVLEAAAAGKPLIATDVGGVPEIFGPCAGRLARPGDAGALARAISDAIEHPAETLNTARALQARVAEHFSVDVMVTAIVGAYKQVQLAARAKLTRDNKQPYARPGILT